MGGVVNIFGSQDDTEKRKSGECIFPYKLTVRQPLKGIKTESVTHPMNECFPEQPKPPKKTGEIYGADGVSCPTKVDEIYNKFKEPGGKHKFWKKDKDDKVPYYDYEEKDDNRPKGYCDMGEYIKRQKKTSLKGKKINPKCKKTFKIKKDGENIPTNYKSDDGKDYTCILENDKTKIKDKFVPQLICPIELDEHGVYDYKKKHKTEDCFI